VVDVLVAAGLAATRSEARRLVDQKAVRLNDQALDDAAAALELKGEAVLRAGKRKFVRLIGT
jgi:tyrosyl-tRNA synthetase